MTKQSKSYIKPENNETKVYRKITNTIESESTKIDRQQKESFDTYSAK